MPSELISGINPPRPKQSRQGKWGSEEILKDYSLFFFDNDPSNPGCIMRIMHDIPLTIIGDWMGYIGWDMPEEEKDEPQKAAEPIMKRPILSVCPLTLNDKIVLEEAGVKVDDYHDYEVEIGAKS